MGGKFAAAAGRGFEETSAAMLPEPSSACPRIAPVARGVDRPFWSVMVPSYNASALLEATLRSVLDQDPGPDRMQIAVVDDASPNGEARRVVAALAPGRVEFHGRDQNLGLAGNWNAAIGLARGTWVHLLHQDDLAYPGFYDRLAAADAARPEALAAFCRHLFLDGDGHWLAISPLERRAPGVLENWLARISDTQRVQCASIAVRRAAYERLGGYRTDLCSALDWEMWNRIAAAGPVWYEPSVLACWRCHPANESSRLSRSGADQRDLFQAIAIINDSLPEALRPAGRQLRAEYRAREVLAAGDRLARGDRDGGEALLRRARSYDPHWGRTAEGRAFQRWVWKLWAKHWWSRFSRRSLR